MADKPNFALLIGKRMSEKDKEPKEPMHVPGEDLPGEEGDQEGMENSAISDFMAAKSPGEAKQALKDFLELAYPELSGPDEDEEASEPEAEA
jgi:hypothetical protein